MERRRSLISLVLVLDVAVAVALGVGGYLLVAKTVIADRFVMPVIIKRFAHVHEFLTDLAARSQSGHVAVLGASVAIEGIDASLIDVHLPPATKCYNLAWAGATPAQWLVMLPAVRQSRPSVAVLCVDLPLLWDVHPLSPEQLSIAGLREFTTSDFRDQIRPILFDQENALLAGSMADHLVGIRRLPPSWLDDAIRQVARSDLRWEGYTTNFRDPWIRRSAAPPEATQRAIEAMAATVTRDDAAAYSRSMESMSLAIQYLQQSGAAVVVVLDPQHPRMIGVIPSELTSRARAELARLCGHHGARFIDHLGLLPEEAFSDHIHPFKDGRERWSSELGRELAQAAGT